MEYGSRIRFVLLTLGAIFLLVLSAWGVIALSKRIIGGDTKKAEITQVQKIDLSDYIRPSTSVKITVQGPIVADEAYRSYDIEIGQDFRRITTYKGYGRAVIESKTFANNTVAYDVFMQSLKRLGFTSVIASASEDETGTCVTGRRFIYELKDQDEQVVRSWNASCSSKIGNFGGSGPSVRALFKAQIPDNTVIIRPTGLAG